MWTVLIGNLVARDDKPLILSLDFLFFFSPFRFVRLPKLLLSFLLKPRTFSSKSTCRPFSVLDKVSFAFDFGKSNGGFLRLVFSSVTLGTVGLRSWI